MNCFRAILTTVAVSVAMIVGGDHDGSSSEWSVTVAKPFGVLENNPRVQFLQASTLPDSAGCGPDCVVPAILGDKLVVVGEGELGGRFVAIPLDDPDRPWKSINQTGIKELGVIEVLDSWFLDQLGCSPSKPCSGIVEVSGTLVSYHKTHDDDLVLEVVPIQQDSLTEDLSEPVTGNERTHREQLNTHTHTTWPLCWCGVSSDEPLRKYYIYIQAIETHDRDGRRVGLSYRIGNAEIEVDAKCPCAN